MENKSTTKLVSSSIKRTLLIFLVGGFILYFIENVVFLVWDIVWIDFINYNPHRSQAHALYLMAESPITALVITLYYSLQLIVGASIAVFSQRIWGRVPFYSLIVMLPLCVFAMYKQIPSGPSAFDYMDLLWLSLRQLPVLVGCWWWSNRTPKR
ncbi:MAG TPA: hypothetical protein VGL27_00535 [Negativicutes bacterium]